METSLKFSVGERRQAFADFGEASVVEVGNHDARSLRLAVEDIAPGVDDQAVAVGLPPVLVPAALSDREKVALVLDGAGAQQDFPVRAAGRLGEGGRNQDQVDRTERTVEFGKRRS
jgi:hypothetical protein